MVILSRGNLAPARSCGARSSRRSGLKHRESRVPFCEKVTRQAPTTCHRIAPSNHTRHRPRIDISATSIRPFRGTPAEPQNSKDPKGVLTVEVLKKADKPELATSVLEHSSVLPEEVLVQKYRAANSMSASFTRSRRPRPGSRRLVCRPE
jgi:hypothetical protein